MTSQDRGHAHSANVLAASQTGAEREAAFAEERAATLSEASNPAVIDEDRDWEQADTDGID